MIVPLFKKTLFIALSQSNVNTFIKYNFFFGRNKLEWLMSRSRQDANRITSEFYGSNLSRALKLNTIREIKKKLSILI